ncbi:DNA polymerase I [Allofustis seminis]|uniref:DNA polymerase I n=1 Tax=Allofustis seminis TaxID=166939 RepID=UPI000370C33C|nr:DNA polymerase I [Allofustis seminis]
MTEKQKMMLIDGHSLVFRAFYALYQQLQSMRNKNGLHTNALYGFHNMLESVIEREQPTHIMVAFDAGRTTFRHEYFDDYKGGRASMPAELAEQMPYFKEMLDAFGIMYYELPNYEADDIIGTLAHQAAANDFEVVILSGDKDLLQLAAENIRVDITRRGVQQVTAYTPAEVAEEYNLSPSQIVDLLGLAGDPSDNIPGVSGIGEKTAIKLLKEYDTIENLYQHIAEMKPSKRKENLLNEKETALLCKKLATILVDAPVSIRLDQLKYKGKHLEKLVDFYQEMDFNSHLKKLDTKSLYEDTPDAERANYSWLDEISKEHLPEHAALHIEIMDEDYHKEVPLAIAWGTQDYIYVTSIEIAQQSKSFVQWLSNPQKQKIVYDSKALWLLFDRYGMQVEGVSFDTMLASYLLTSEDTSKEFYFVAQKYGLTQFQPSESIYGKGAKRQIPTTMEKVYQYAAEKIAALNALQPKLQEALVANEQLNLLETLEMPLARILAKMEKEGIKVDPHVLKQLQKEFGARLQQIEEAIYQEAGERFNINSPKQLSEILFEKLNYPVIRKTKTGYSTAQDVLEKLAAHAPIAQYILDYRGLSKIQSTYIDGMLKVIDKKTSLVHTRYQQTVARTGRLSSKDPNLQNIPIRQEEGRMIRKAFHPKREGWELYSADYSQIELRLLAHISGDEHMLKAFQDGEDIHLSTAMRIYGKNAEDITPNLRRDAKAVNFGIVYGISDYGLSENLGISRKAAKNLIDTYFERYPGVKKYIETIIRETKEKEYVETLYGRRRYLPDINNRNFNLRSFAERVAMNTPIQGSAADIIKMAMIAVSNRMEREALRSKMLLQVHDELIFEVPQDEKEALVTLVKEEMEHIADLNVPLKVDGGFGKTWYEL